jgi:PAS domain S-box-containing protein
MTPATKNRVAGENTRAIAWQVVGVVTLLTLFACGLLLTVSREIRHSRDSREEIQRTREIVEAVQKVFSVMQDAEAGERGFLITGQESFLPPYHSAGASLEKLLHGLDGLIKDESARQIFHELELQAKQQLRLLDRIVSARMKGDTENSAGIETQVLAKSQMDQLRAVVERLQARQKILLDARIADFVRISRQSERIAQLALGAAALLALITSVLMIRNYHRARHAEAAFRDQAIRLGTTLDNVADAIVTINESGSIESWSRAAQNMFGYSEEEVLRRNVKMLMTEPHASAHDGYLRRYVATSERRIMGMRRELEARHKDGHAFPIELAVSEMRLNSRRLFIGSMRDITMRLEVEQLKSGFVSTVSHELRTPLTSISGSLSLIAGGAAGELPPKAQRLAEIALSNSERLVRLINDILDLEKAESGKMEFSLVTDRLRPVVKQALEMSRGHAQSLGVVLELAPDSDDASVLIDRDRLLQVLTNLLSNAAKFSPRGGTIRTGVRIEPDSVRVEVHNHGSVIAPEFRKRIFQRFAQADSSDTRAKGGTGLGLSICKTLIERLGGTIGFSSEPATGTTFYITLPLHHPVANEEAIPHGASPAPKVLVCEDDPDIAELVARQLAASGMATRVATTVRAAAVTLGHEHFDILLIDVDLPDSNGLDFIEEVRSCQATQNLPIIVTTSRSKAVFDPNGLSDLRLVAWLEKPVRLPALVDLIRKSLAEPSRHGTPQEEPRQSTR